MSVDTLSQHILSLRDSGMTLQAVADHFGLATRQQARTFWIRGLRMAGRENEIQTRTINAIVGGRMVEIDTNDLTDTFTFTPNMRWTTFGAEIECFNLGMTGCARSLRSAGITAYDEGYNHNTRPHWKIVSDSSICGNAAAEVVSPVLREDAGLRELRSAMMALRESNARVNSSCGGHIHIGVDGWLSDEQQVQLIRYWWLIEPMLDMLILSRRRNADYARHLLKRECDWMSDQWQTGDKNINSGMRYRTLNLCAWARQGTFEVRMHHGSLNGKNHVAWVIFLQAAMLWIATAEEYRLMSMADAIYGMSSIANMNEWEITIAHMSDDAKRDALGRWLETMAALGYITEDVATYLKGRAQWIKNRTNSGRGI